MNESGIHIYLHIFIKVQTLFTSHRRPTKDIIDFEGFVFKYLHLISKPLEGYKSRVCSYDKKANAELQAQTPEHWSPHHLM